MMRGGFEESLAAIERGITSERYRPSPVVDPRPTIPLTTYAPGGIFLMWDVEVTDQFIEWWDTLSVEEQEAISAAVELLEQRGPGLGRPVVDSITSSRHANMKELRTGTTRTLFAFNPIRAAILLIGGNKRERWQELYAEMIPLADDLFDEHLTELENEGGA
jgi:hypothetical protein